MLLDRLGPPGRCSGCWRRPRRAQLRGQLRHDPIAPAGQGGSGVLSLRHFGLVLFIPWRVGAEESGAAKNGLRAQHLNNALTECLKWGRVNLLCHGRARASFSLTLRAGAMLRLLDRIGPPGRCSGCWRRPRRAQLRGQLRHDPIAPAGQGGSGVLSLRHFGLVLFIPWRVGAEESGAAKNGLRAQHLNNALTECLKWGRVNLLCHGRARASFSLTLRAGAMLLERIGRLGGAAAAGGGRDALSYGVSFATTRSHQLARGAPACFLSGISGWFSLSLGAWVPKNLARRKMAYALSISITH